MRRVNASRLAVLAIVALPLLVKVPLLAGWLICEPSVLYGNLMTKASYLTPGRTSTLDPNIGFTSHALGTYAARTVLAGGSPWWNPLEGIGQPLVGEMQSAALFPPTLLLLLPKGQLIEHLLFQVVAGLATFALLRTMRVGIAGALTGGVLFEFNGAYAWLANAVINPICFLPVILLGVERLRLGRIGSAAPLVAGGVAASLYAGFPEVAYLDGLLVGVWSACRIVAQPASDRARFTLTLAALAAAGVMLAAPPIVAFLDFLPVANVGLHGGAMAGAYLHKAFGVSVVLPYFYGNLYGSDMMFWGNVGGYAGASLTALALAGGLGRSDRLLRRTLVAWIALSLAVSFGVQPILFLFQLLPLAKQTASYRYLDASWLMAACVLAGLAVDDLRRRGGGALRVGVVLTAVFAGALVALALAFGTRPGHAVTTLGSSAVQALALLALAAAALRRRSASAGSVALVAAAAMGEAVVLFAAPIAGNPYRAEADLAGVEFLRAHLGLQRFATLGPLAANYGSYYGLAEVNHNDLPVPRVWTDYVRRRLDPRIEPTIVEPVSAARMLARLPAWAAVGTRYLVARADAPVAGLTQVHADRAMRIYAVPGVRPYLSAPGCTVAASSRTEARVTCARATPLVRLEAFMPGWTASVDGRAAELRPFEDAFQAVTVPAGTSTVRFAFAPPGIAWGYALAAAGLVLVAALALRRRGGSLPGAVPTGA